MLCRFLKVFPFLKLPQWKAHNITMDAHTIITSEHFMPMGTVVAGSSVAGGSVGFATVTRETT